MITVVDECQLVVLLTSRTWCTETSYFVNDRQVIALNMVVFVTITRCRCAVHHLWCPFWNTKLYIYVMSQTFMKTGSNTYIVHHDTHFRSDWVQICPTTEHLGPELVFWTHISCFFPFFVDPSTRYALAWLEWLHGQTTVDTCGFCNDIIVAIVISVDMYIKYQISLTWRRIF